MVPNITRRGIQPLIVHALYGTVLAKGRRHFSDGGLDALALCILEGLGVKHEVGGALSPLEANDPWR